MSVPRTLYVVVGAIAAPAGVCVGAMAPVAGILAGTIAAALVLLVTTAGALLAADWWADQQSRQAWAEVAPALAEWKPIVRTEVGDIETRYPPAVADDVMRELLRAHRFLPARAAVMEVPVVRSAFPAAAMQSLPTRMPCPVAQWSQPVGENDARAVLRACAIDEAMLGVSRGRPANSVTLVAGGVRAGGYYAVDGTRARLVVNAGPSWLLPDLALATPRHAAEVVVLSSCRHAQHTRPAEDATETVRVTGTEPPNCRGPPSLEQRRLTRRAAAKAGCAAPAAKVSDGDLVVLDNLGQPVPVCAAEVDAIETRLGEVLDELFASRKAGSELDRA